MLYLGAASFFTFGIVLVLLGASQADVARDLGLDLAGSGVLGATLAIGIGVGVFVAGPLCDRFSRRPLFIGACALSASSLLAIDEVEFPRSRRQSHYAACLSILNFNSNSIGLT
jgi:MFS family permease